MALTEFFQLEDKHENYTTSSWKATFRVPYQYADMADVNEEKITTMAGSSPTPIPWKDYN